MNNFLSLSVDQISFQFKFFSYSALICIFDQQIVIKGLRCTYQNCKSLLTLPKDKSPPSCALEAFTAPFVRKVVIVQCFVPSDQNLITWE